MNRRTFLAAGAAVSLGGQVRSSRADRAGFPEPPPLSFRKEKSALKITAIRAVRLVPIRPPPKYRPAPGSWNTTEVEVANPLSIYPRFKARRSLFYADDLGPARMPQASSFATTRPPTSVRRKSRPWKR